jgi:hypothetical protein
MIYTVLAAVAACVLFCALPLAAGRLTECGRQS